MCSSPDRLNVQPTCPSCGAACRPAHLCSSPACGKFIFFIWQLSPHGPPALRLVLSKGQGALVLDFGCFWTRFDPEFGKRRSGSPAHGCQFGLFEARRWNSAFFNPLDLFWKSKFSSVFFCRKGLTLTKHCLSGMMHHQHADITNILWWNYDLHAMQGAKNIAKILLLL